VAGVISASDVSSSTGASATTDYIGIITLVFGLCALVFAIMQGPVWHWSAPVIVILLVSGVLLLLGLIVVELRVSPEPLLDLHLFRNATFSGSILLIFVAQFSKISVVVFVPEYLQEVLGMSPFATGLALLPAMVPVPITGIVVARLVDRVGVRWFCLVGLSMIGVSLSWIAFSVSLRSYALFAPVLVVWGIGLSFVFSPPRKAIFDVVSPSKRGQSSGLAYSAQLLGSTIGMAICSSLFAMIGSLWVVFFVSAVMAFAALVVCWFSIGYSTRQPTTPHSYMLA
jgi:predicted MFS family arabinose efflux permease